MIVRCDREGERADLTLSRLVPSLTRSAAQKLLREGKVTSEGDVLAKNARTAEGQILEFELPEPEPEKALPEDIPLDIRYEDGDVLVVNKPKGLVVHPAAGHWSGTLVNALLFHCGEEHLSGLGGPLRPGIVHRIDKDTSGLLVVAKTDLAFESLSAQIAEHAVSRIYETVVCGGVREDSGVIDAPIGRHPVDRKKMAVLPGGRPAVTHFEVLERFRGYTHLRCRLETGRTHQIRVHLAYKNHPVLGDTVYGSRKPEMGMDSQCLHAQELSFRHPRTGKIITVKTELPDYFEAVLRRLPML